MEGRSPAGHPCDGPGFGIFIGLPSGRSSACRKELGMKIRKSLGLFMATALLAGITPLTGAGEIPSVLRLKEQAAVYDAWLSARLDKLLPELMRREKIDMWLVI